MGSAILSEWLQSPSVSSTARPPSLCKLNGLPFGSEVSLSLSAEADCNNSPTEALELGTLHPALDRPFTFFPCPPTSCPVRQEPTPTFRSSKSCSPFRAANLYAGLPSLAGGLSFRTPSPTYPHDQLFADRLLSIWHQNPSDWRLPLAANLEPLPSFPLPYD
jgi:hypothetical protein